MQQDVEGLIEAGAPNDEYDDEAAQCFTAIQAMPDNEVTKEAVLDVLSVIWAKSFNLGSDELALRAPELEKAAQQLTA